MEGDLAGFEVVLALFCACTVRVIGQLFFYLWLTLISRLLPPSVHILSLCHLFIHLRHPTPYARDIRFYDNTTRLLLTTSIHTRIHVRWRPQVHVPRGRHDRPIRYTPAYYENLANSRHKWYTPPSEFTFWYDTTQYVSDASDLDVEIWHNTVQYAQEQIEHKLMSLMLLFELKTHVVRDAFVAATGLLEKMGLSRDSTKPYSISGFIVQEVQPGTVPIVIDTGCSISVTPFLEDFASELQPAQEDSMQGLKDSVHVKGVGWVDWTIRDVFNRVALVRTQAYYVPDARIRLLSTQTYFKEHDGGNIVQDHEKVTLNTPNGERLTFPYDLGSNLPLMYLDHRSPQVGLSGRQVMNLTTSKDIEHTLSLLDEINHNMSKPQKELMLWHQRLGHAGFRWIQSLMRKPKHEVGDNQEPPVLPTKIAATSNCDPTRCPACQLSKAHRRSPKTHRILARPEMEMSIRREDLNPGDCISMDQYQARVPGRLPSTYGKEPPNKQYSGGTIFVDHSSGYVHINHQVSLRMGDTLQGKHDFERFAEQYGVRLKSFHADNSPFASTELLDDLELQEQTITFSGVGAHFQNGVSERAIQTITSWALSFMMHQLLHWPANFHEDLWPFAMDHAVLIWNNMPQSRSGLSPLELFTRTKHPRHDVLLHTRVWGCPVYVLDPALQDGKKLPKWTKKSRLAMYLGQSPVHSPTIGRILDLRTGHVSPQYHVVYDELFNSVQGQLTAELFDEETWKNLIRLGYYRADDLTDVQGDVVPFHDYYDDFVGPLAQPDHESDSASSSSTSESTPDTDTDTSSDTDSSSSSDSDSIPPARPNTGFSGPGPRGRPSSSSSFGSRGRSTS